MSEITPDESEERLGELLDDAVPSFAYQGVPLVGVGASAASHGAVEALLQSVPARSGIAYVAVLRGAIEPRVLDAMAERLRRHTGMPVHLLARSRRVEPDQLYLVPPQRGVRAFDGSLVLTDEEREHGRMVVDLFFRSLADTHGPQSAAVVLSGDGVDGTLGLKRIKERGGLTVAQDPEEARQDAMPRAAIGTNMVDWVLRLEDMPARLLAYFGLRPQIELPPEDGPHLGERARPDDRGEASLRELLALLRTRTGRDFSQYKRATVLRRIARRMQVNGVHTLGAYVDCLRNRPGEPGALLQDLLITVTNFFRDAGCFAALQEQLPALFEGKGPEDTLRVWVAACATGEEAYSLGMLLSEHARGLDAPPAIQIFATDLDESAIQAAREGSYSAAIETDVSEERLRRFFTRDHGGYRVRRELRELVLFASHDVLKDAPFSRLDLVSCRNLLIYLSRGAQQRVFETFHFAMVPRGHLFLGSSEAVDDGSTLFQVVDKKHRLYRQRPLPRPNPPLPARRYPSTLALDAPGEPAGAAPAPAQELRPPPARERAPAGVPSWGEVHLRLLEHIAPPSILVDAEYDIVHLSPSAGRFLQFGGGEPSRNLLRSVHPGLRIELRAALYQAGQALPPSVAPPIPIRLGGDTVPVSVRVLPAEDIGHGLFVVLLQAGAPDDAVADPQPLAEPDPVAAHLDRELDRLKAHLRQTVEQYEGSAEELKASNEELQAMNEELRSATEELETSREELQSINEELTTVNHELKSKVEELGNANSDLQNLMDATAIATVFLDRELRITRYTPFAVGMFNLIPTDVGRPLTDLKTQLQYPELGSDAARVLERLVPVEREVGEAGGKWFLARVLPYRTVDDRIAGLVLSFVDITERKQAEEVRVWLSAVVNFTADGIVSFSLDQTILSWNAGAERIFGHSAAEAVGRTLAALLPEVGESDDVMQRVKGGQVVDNLETTRVRKDGSRVEVSLTVSPIRDGSGRVTAATAIIRDITAARAAAERGRENVPPLPGGR